MHFIIKAHVFPPSFSMDPFGHSSLFSTLIPFHSPPIEHSQLWAIISLPITAQLWSELARVTESFAHNAKVWDIGLMMPSTPISFGVATPSHFPQCHGFSSPCLFLHKKSLSGHKKVFQLLWDIHRMGEKKVIYGIRIALITLILPWKGRITCLHQLIFFCILLCTHSNACFDDV